MKKKAIAFNEDDSFQSPITLNLNFFLETFVYFQPTASSDRREIRQSFTQVPDNPL
jgi:hypothetical protein